MAPKLILNMIVKNEAHCIRRCLDSVLPWIDGWVIVDTGSADGTQDVIREHLCGVPGALYERPWTYQVANRNEALEHARSFTRSQFGCGDHHYALLIDADETLEGELLPAILKESAYELQVRHKGGSTQWARTMIVRMSDWDWGGKRRHPYMKARVGNPKSVPITTMWVNHHADGASWADPEKYRRHMEDMAQDLADDPDNPRLVYYMAQSCRDAQKPEEALKWFQRRSEMGGWEEEAWYATYQAALLRRQLGQDPYLVEEALRQAAYRRPQRAEAWFHLAKHLRGQQRHEEAVKAARRAVIAATKKQEDRLFVDQAVYQWMAMGELAMCLHSGGDSLMALIVMLAVEAAVPPDHKAWLEAQLGWFMRGVHEVGK